MAIVVNLDLLLVKRKMKLTELAGRVDITLANLSVLKQNKARAVRFSTLDALCRELGCQPGDLLEYQPDAPQAAGPVVVGSGNDHGGNPRIRRLTRHNNRDQIRSSADLIPDSPGERRWIPFTRSSDGSATGFWSGSSPRRSSARWRPPTCSRGMGRHSLLRHVTGGFSAAGTILAGVVVSLILLLLALAVLKALLDLRPWARMVMLVVGWITVVSAALDLLTLPGTSSASRAGGDAHGRWLAGVRDGKPAHKGGGPGVLVLGDLCAADERGRPRGLPVSCRPSRSRRPRIRRSDERGDDGSCQPHHLSGRLPCCQSRERDSARRRPPTMELRLRVGADPDRVAQEVLCRHRGGTPPLMVILGGIIHVRSNLLDWFCFSGLTISPAGSAPGFNEQSTPAPSPERFAKVRAMILEGVQKSGVPSISIAAAEDGRIVWEESFGFADKEKNAKATPDSLYALASISKAFTGTGLMVLAEKKLVDLDKPVNDYLGEAKLTAHVGSAGQATLRRMLYLEAGMPMHWNIFYATEPARPPSQDESIRRYGIIVNEPGREYVYSNFAYGVLDRVISHVSGKGYPEFMKREVFEPLQMNRTSVHIAPELAAYAVQNYDAAGRSLPPLAYDHDGASAVYSSVHDLIRFGLFHLKNRVPGKKPILSPASLDLLHRPSSLNASEISTIGEPRMAMGWGVVDLAGLRFVIASGASSRNPVAARSVPGQEHGGGHPVQCQLFG